MSGPGTVTYSNANALNSTVSFSAAGTCVLRLTASDGEIVSRDYVSIVVQGASSQMFERRLSGGSNDAEQATSGGVTLNSSDLDLGAMRVGLRFTNILIPRNATITAAYVQFQADEVTTAGASATIRGQAADNAATLTASSNNISSRPTTTASSAWGPAAWGTVGEAGVAQRTNDIRARRAGDREPQRLEQRQCDGVVGHR